jgi:hypothetical protein
MDGPGGTGDIIYVIETVEVTDVINTDGQGNTSTGTATSTATATSTVASNDYRFDVNSYFGPEVGANAPIDVSIQEAYSVETIVEVPIMVPWDEPFKQTTVVTGTATATRTADGPE